MIIFVSTLQLPFKIELDNKKKTLQSYPFCLSFSVLSIPLGHIPSVSFPISTWDHFPGPEGASFYSSSSAGLLVMNVLGFYVSKKPSFHLRLWKAYPLDKDPYTDSSCSLLVFEKHCSTVLCLTFLQQELSHSLFLWMYCLFPSSYYSVSPALMYLFNL